MCCWIWTSRISRSTQQLGHFSICLQQASVFRINLTGFTLNKQKWTRNTGVSPFLDALTCNQHLLPLLYDSHSQSCIQEAIKHSSKSWYVQMHENYHQLPALAPTCELRTRLLRSHCAGGGRNHRPRFLSLSQMSSSEWKCFFSCTKLARLQIESCKRLIPMKEMEKMSKTLRCLPSPIAMWNKSCN